MNTFNHQNPPTIEKLKAAGYTVRVEHLRPVISTDQRPFLRYLPNKALTRVLYENLIPMNEIRNRHLQGFIFPRSGITRIVVSKEGQPPIIGQSTCSAQDIFDRRAGITRSLWDLVTRLP